MKKYIFGLILALSVSLVLPACSGKARLTASGYKQKPKKTNKDVRKLKRVRLW